MITVAVGDIQYPVNTPKQAFSLAIAILRKKAQSWPPFGVERKILDSAEAAISDASQNIETEMCEIVELSPSKLKQAWDDYNALHPDQTDEQSQALQALIDAERAFHSAALFGYVEIIERDKEEEPCGEQLETSQD